MAQIKVLVFPRQVKNGNKKFTAYKTKVNLDCYTYDKKAKAYTDEHSVKTIYIDLKFRQSVKNNLGELKRGYILIDSKNVEIPNNNKTWTDENGDIRYPSVWIKNEGYKEFHEVIKEPKQSAFADFEDDTEDIELSNEE